MVGRNRLMITQSKKSIKPQRPWVVPLILLKVACTAILPLVFFFLLVIPTASYAETKIHTSIRPDRGPIDTTFLLQISISGNDFSKSSAPVFIETSDFSLESRSSSVQQQIINREVTFQKTFIYELIIKKDLKPGQYKLPKGSILLEGKETLIPPTKITIEPGSNSSGRTGRNSRSLLPPQAQGNYQKDPRLPSNADEFSFVQTISNENPYIGQQLSYRVDVITPTNLSAAKLQEFEPENVWRERFGEDEKSTRIRQKIPIHSFSEAWFPVKSGSITVPSRELRAEVRVMERRRLGLSGGLSEQIFGDLLPFVSQFRSVEKNVVSNQLEIDVRPLPPPKEVINGYIPVGSLKVTSSIDSDKVDMGDSITLTVQLSGDANLRPYKLPKSTPEQKKHFKRYDDKPIVKRVIENGRVLFYKTFKTSFVPQRPGAFELPSLTLNWFDPEENDYAKYITKATPIRILGNPDDYPVLVDNKESLHENESGNDSSTIKIEELKEKYGKNILILPKLFSITLPFILLLMSFLASVLYFLSPYISLNTPSFKRRYYNKYCNSIKDDQMIQGEDTEKLLRSYISDKLSISAQSLTSQELCAELTTRINNQESISEITSFIEQSQELRYAGSNPPPVKGVDFKKMLSILDKSL